MAALDSFVLIQYGAGVTRNLDCPKEMVGRVIGKGGETIKAMQREFQANIQIDQTSLPMKITISGQPASVERAYAVVAEIVAGGNPYIGGSVGHAGTLSIRLQMLPALLGCHLRIVYGI